MSTKQKWSVTIGWGKDGRPNGPDQVDDYETKTTHTFATRGELAAFLKGVSASNGHDEYTIYSSDSVFIGEMNGLWDDLREAGERTKYVLEKLLKPEFLREFVCIYGNRAATVGTAAHDYISRKLDRTEVERDARYLGAVECPDGALLLFNDGSKVMALREGPTEAMSHAISDAMERDRERGSDGDA